MKLLTILGMCFIAASCLSACRTSSAVSEKPAEAVKQADSETGVSTSEGGSGDVDESIVNDKLSDPVSNDALNGDTSDNKEMPEQPSDEDLAVNEDLTRCEAKIEFSSEVYAGESFGPSIEEARENAIEEGCAVPCADRLSDTAQESEREDMLESCIEKCALEEAIIIAAQCWLKGESIYVEGAWSSGDDSESASDYKLSH